jgi:hypothetical protein
MESVKYEGFYPCMHNLLEYWLLSLMSTLVMGFGPQD